MTRTLTFTVAGIPAPQGSKQPYGKGRVESSTAVKPWREAVKWAAWGAMGPDAAPFDGPLALHVVFHMPRPGKPKSWAPDRRPDVSKLVRSTEDALTDAAVWADDARVTDLHVLKRYAAQPGATITISEVDEQ